MEYMSEQLQCIRNYFEKRSTELDTLEKLEWIRKNDAGENEIHRGFKWSKEEFEELLQSSVFVTEFTDKLLDRKFRELLEPFIFDHGKKTIFCKLEANDEVEGTYLFSACTDAMRKVDEAFFKKRETYSVLDILYKPYLYELSVEKADLNMKFERGIWYEIGIKKEDKEDREDKKYEEENGRDWIKNKVSGHLTYSASPLVSEIVYLEWRKAIDGNVNLPGKIVIDKNDIDGNTDGKKIDQEMNKMFKDAVITDLRVYRVGQANFIYGYNKIQNQQKCFTFDIGIPTDGNLYREINGVQDKNGTVNKDKSGIFDDYLLNSISPELIMISHWHQDHYKGAYTLSRSMYRKSTAPTWIGPIYGQNRSGTKKPEEECYNADRLVAYLLRLGKIVFMPKDHYYNSKPGGEGYILCCGKGTGKNNAGVLLQLRKTLLPGDCACEYWPQSYATLDKVDYIVVPHHGSDEFDFVEAEKRLKLKTQGRCKAIICVGENNEYGHPDRDAVDFYQNTLQCKEIIQTKDVKNPSDIWITNP